MPRYYRRRYTRVVRPKKKWASNILVWNNLIISDSYGVTLVSNSAQSGTPTPSILKTGNFKVSADLTFEFTPNVTGTFNFACIAYIIYVPEGWELAPTAFDNLITKHPEWVMATKTMGTDVIPSATSRINVESVNMSTRLKRNLNSGDQVVFYIRLNKPTNVEIIGSGLTGTCRYWTCSN